MAIEETLNFCEQEGIQINKWFSQEITQNNPRPFVYTAYAIRELLDVPGVKELLIHTLAPPNPLSELERVVHNALVELHGLYFVSEGLELRISRAEADKIKVYSPFRTGNKSCDILATDGEKEFYFECKDHSSEIVTSYPNQRDPRFRNFKPSFGDKVASWIGYMCRDASEKGATTLICKVPRWKEQFFDTDEELDNWWVHEFFDVNKSFGPRDHLIEPPEPNISPSLTDVCILSLSYDDHIRLRLSRQITNS